MPPWLLRLRVRSLFVFSLRTLRLPPRRKLIAVRKKNWTGCKPNKSSRKRHREPKARKQIFRVQKGVHTRDPVSRQFQNNQGPRLVTAFRIGPILSECRPARGKRGNQPRSPAAASQPEHPRSNFFRSLQPHRIGRHAERRVLSHQRRQAIDVVALERRNV